MDSSAEAPGSPSWGDWRTGVTLLAGVTSLARGPLVGATFRLPTGREAPGSSGLPSGNGVVQEPGLHWVEFAAAGFVPLGVDPHPEGVLTL
jgi:hypothetical protein